MARFVHHRSWSTRLTHLLLLGTVLMGFVARAQVGAGELPGTLPPIDLQGWAYRWDPPLPHAEGEPLRWANPSLWQPTIPGLRMPDRGDRDVAWMRVPLPDLPWADPALYFGGVDSEFEAYLNGKQIYRSAPPRGRGPPGWPFYLFRLPPGASGQPLYLRVHSSNPLTLGPFSGTQVGSRSDLLLRMLAHGLEFSLIGLLSAAFGAIALLVWAFDRRMRLYLWFALFAIGQGCVYVAISGDAKLVWSSPAGWAGVLWVGRTLFPAGIVCFFAELLEDPRRTRLLQAAFATLAVGGILVALALIDYAPLRLALFWGLNAEFLVCFTTVFVLAGRFVRRTGRGRLLLIASMVLVLTTFLPNILRSAGLIVLPELSHWAYAVLLLGMGLVLLRRFVEVHGALTLHANELESKNRRLQEVEATLKEAVRARDAFLSIASHELRSPLAIITNHTHLLSRERASQTDERSRVEAIQRQTRHLVRIVDDLLDVSRIAHGKLTLKPEPLSLGLAVEEALANQRSAAEAAAVSVTWTPPSEPVWVRADSTRLDQIVGNLVRNALKFTRAGGHTWVSLQAVGNEAVLTVRDDGVGIPPDVLPRMFELFVQGTQPRGQTASGLGVGLALVRQLVEMHGGSVRAQSDGAGLGSTFEVRLPRCEPAVAPPRVTPSALPTPGIRVLLVEDNHNLRLSMRLALKTQAFEILEASDGEEGLRAMLESRVDVAVVDIAMPKMDGFAVARAVRSSKAGSAVRLIALTGYGQPHDRAKAQESGFDRLLVKPVDPEDLANAIREVHAEPPAAARVA